jgi:hypothetical protein
VNLCSKPRCTRPGSVALAYDYSDRRAILEDHPEGELSPHLYPLCITCAEGLRPPRGWTLEDQRSTPRLFGERSELVHATAGGAPEIDEDPEPARERQLFFGSSF